MDSPGDKVSIQPLNEWKNSCIQHGTPFTEFPNSAIVQKKFNNSKISILKNVDVSNTSNTDNQLEQQVLFQQFLQFLQSQQQIRSQRLSHDEATPI
ncbi:4514_t:CDS:2 [Racocetra fulgida]|uniref:4514_t:CDS:1 n=1 Tax=Racocetra fulgida TaxID=60492 RepID=A0A9N9AUL5_9GLOM|nr:4514_t:CDS:2 [Racocetra fulgida]